LQPVISVIQLNPGEKGRIVRVKLTKAEEVHKLAAFGFFPGVEVKLLQKVPNYVLKIGYTQIALDREIAETIVVIKSECAH
jgi:DtxR family Mn-dependent transcriptional regulator/ferrous iron transport protein A